MAVTGITAQPRVVKLGGAWIDRDTYESNDTIAKGDFIRITTAGTIKLAKLDSDTLGAVHGLALKAHAAATDIACPVMLFAEDTVVRMQCQDSVAPEDIVKGTVNIFDSGSISGTWALADDTTKGFVTVVGYADDDFPWTDTTGRYDYASDSDNGFIDVQFLNDDIGIPVLGGRAGE